MEIATRASADKALQEQLRKEPDTLLDNRLKTLGESFMATWSKENKQPLWRAAKWQRYKHQRVLILWEVVALSLGAEPDSQNIANARKDSHFEDAYLQRIKSLTRMMSAVPEEGHVTFFPWHVYNQEKRLARNRMVDVVSCIDKLIKTDVDELPSEFLRLRETLSQIPLPKEPPRNSGLVIASNIVVTASAAKDGELANGTKLTEASLKKKDQSKAVSTKENEQISAMFYAVVCDAYGYDASSSTSLKETVEEIENALTKVGIKGGYGLSVGKIQEVLRVGKGHCPEILPKHKKAPMNS